MRIHTLGAAHRALAAACALSIVGGCGGLRPVGPVDTTPTPPPPTHAQALAIVTQPPSSAASGVAFDRQPVVQLTDAAGAPVNEVGVTVTVRIASGGGTLNGVTTATTDASGAARFNSLSIAGTIGPRTLVFTTGSISVVSTAVTVAAGPASKLSIVTQPSASTQSGDTLAQHPVIQLLDAWNNLSTTAGVAITAGIASGGGTLSGSITAVTDASGRATFTALVVTGSGAQTLRFSGTGLGSVESNAITLVTPPPPDTTPAAVLLMSEGFDNASLAARGWYDMDAGPLSISTTEHTPGSTGSLQVSFPRRATVPSPQAVARHLFTATNAVYVRYWEKHSANWVGSGQSYHPHELYLLTTEDNAYVGPSSTHLTVYVEENVRADGGSAVLSAQDAQNIDVSAIRRDLTGVTERRAIAGCNGSPDDTPTDCYSSGGAWLNGKTWYSDHAVFVDAPGASYKGDWHEVEAYVKLNSIVGGIGQRDGVAQCWVDGVLVIDRHDLMFRTGVHASMQFNQLLIGPYIGDGSPVAQTIWIDDLLLMTARP